MVETESVEQLQRLVTGFAGSTVRQVRVPPGGDGQFGVQLGFTRRGGDGTTRAVRRWLVVSSVAWRLDGPDGVVAASGDAEQRLAEDLAVLTGREIDEVRVRPPGWDTLIRLGGLELTVFPLYHRTPEAAPDWTFRMPSGQLLVVGPGPRWRLTA